MNDAATVLRRIARAQPDVAPGERCEMCAAAMGEEHSHVVDVRNRALKCTCRPCALLFTSEAPDLAFRAVPDRYLSFGEFAMSHGQWDDLAIPVGMAFFFKHSTLGKVVAFYPSPAGATESELPMDSWDGIVTANPRLEELREDVEAVLLRRQGDDIECYLVPIDVCYELVGHLRRLWRGFDGGVDVHRQLDEFFAGIAARAKPA